MAKHKILVVDDEESLCEILQFNLEVEGYEADVAYSAEQALRMHPERYSLILLDVMMGEMSGFRMAQLLKADPETARVPVIFCTAKDSEDDTVAGLNIGADDYITKPFSVREVLARVRSVLRRTSAARAESESIRFEGLEMTSFSKEYQNERVEALIEEFRLQKVRKSLGIQLSGGERRRTEIARAVAINPAFILLDEPFAGVDPIAVEDIQSIVATLKHKNIGVIITDHNVDETLAITDRTYLLYEGKILKTGTAEELAADPMVRKVYLGQHFELKKSHQLTQQMKNRKGQQAQQAGEETETQE